MASRRHPYVYHSTDSSSLDGKTTSLSIVALSPNINFDLSIESTLSNTSCRPRERGTHHTQVHYSSSRSHPILLLCESKHQPKRNIRFLICAQPSGLTSDGRGVVALSADDLQSQALKSSCHFLACYYLTGSTQTLLLAQPSSRWTSSSRLQATSS